MTRPGVEVEVLNADVPGSSSNQALRYLEIGGVYLDPDAIAFVDLVDVVRGRPDLFIDVVHMSPRGYGLVAQQIATASGFPDRILP